MAAPTSTRPPESSIENHPRFPKTRYSPFYEDCARYSELAKFRRYAPQWAKLLYDDEEELDAREQELTRRMMLHLPSLSSSSDRSVTYADLPRALWKDNKEMLELVQEFNQLLRQHSNDLLLNEGLAKMPQHNSFYGKYLPAYGGLIVDGVFGPTGNGQGYDDADAIDFVALAAFSQDDWLTTAYLNNSIWIENHVWKPLRALWTWGRSLSRSPSSEPDPEDNDSSENPSERISRDRSHIVRGMNILSAISTSILSMAMMFALTSQRGVEKRIAMAGFFGLLYAVSAVFLVTLSQKEIYMLLMAYFAVGAVFIGNPLSEGGQLRE